MAAHQVAERYMYAFTRGDVTALKGFYNAESLYEDPHAGVSLRGPEEILKHHQARFPFAERQQIIVRRKMDRGDLVVFFYEIRVRAKAEAFEPAKQKLHFIIPKVAVLRIKDGIVSHHVDQTDLRSFDQQMKQYGVQLKEK
ncbi:nuclear transport factor 2 family protein [Acanthopleuribacter pedis]